MYKGYRIGVVIPALNEAPCVEQVIIDICILTHANNTLIDEIVLCDNGSTDATASIAEQAGAQVVHQPIKGYGIACLTAIAAMKPVDIVLFINADGAEIIKQSVQLLDEIIAGADLVIGSRTLGQNESGAMYLHQRIGTKLVVSLINFIWRQKLTDLGPFRAIRWEVLETLNLQDKDFGWTVEMQIQAFRKKFVTVEIAINTRRSISHSKVSGTLSGTINTAKKMFSTIFYFAYQDACLKLKNILKIKTSRNI